MIKVAIHKETPSGNEFVGHHTTHAVPNKGDAIVWKGKYYHVSGVPVHDWDMDWVVVIVREFIEQPKVQQF